MRIESAVLEGSKNAIKLLQSAKSQEKKALQEVSNIWEGRVKYKNCTEDPMTPYGVMDWFR